MQMLSSNFTIDCYNKEKSSAEGREIYLNIMFDKSQT